MQNKTISWSAPILENYQISLEIQVIDNYIQVDRSLPSQTSNNLLGPLQING